MWKTNIQASKQTCYFEPDGSTQKGIEETRIKRRLKKKKTENRKRDIIIKTRQTDEKQKIYGN